MGDWGWTLGMKDEIISSEKLRRRAEGLDVSKVETRFLNRDAMSGMMHFWKGAFEGMNEIEVNTELDPVIDRYYRKADWGW